MGRKTKLSTQSRPTKRPVLWMAGGGAAAVLGLVLVWRGGLESIAAQSAPVWYDYEVVNVYPHDPSAFTQGLLFRDGRLYESTGLRGRSTLREVRLETGEVVRQRSLEPRYFGEGLTDWGEALIQLTWQANVGFVYDLETFELLRTFRYPGEGWGLARDDEHLIMSDGTAELRFLDPATFEERHRITVTEEGREVRNLNELEVIDGKVYANVFLTDEVVIIDPTSGRVTGRIDLRGLLTPTERRRTDVLNGIAYDVERDRLFVTGKLWPKLFEIELRRR